MINIYSSREAKEIGENIGRSFLRLRHSFQRNCNLEKCIHLFIIILMTILLFEMLVYIVLFGL